MDAGVVIVLLALISSSTAVTLNVGEDEDEDEDPKISGIDVIIDGEVRWRDLDVAEVYLGEDRRGNITFRCRATPSHGDITWELSQSPGYYRKVRPTDAIPTEFEPGPHTTGGADLIFHVTDLNNVDRVRCEIKTASGGYDRSSSKSLSLAYPVAADVRQTNGAGKYYGQKKVTVAASGNPALQGLRYTRLHVEHEGNTIVNIEGRLFDHLPKLDSGRPDASGRGRVRRRRPDAKIFEFGVDPNLQYENITLKLVEKKREGWTSVVWLKRVRVAELAYQERGDLDEEDRERERDRDRYGVKPGVKYAIIIAVVCFIVILICAVGCYFCRKRCHENREIERVRQVPFTGYVIPPADVAAPPPFNSTGYAPGYGGEGEGRLRLGFAPAPPNVAGPPSYNAACNFPVVQPGNGGGGGGEGGGGGNNDKPRFGWKGADSLG